MQLKDIAFARSGDKGDVVNVGVLAHDDAAYQTLVRALTPERIKAHFGDWVRGEVDVFPMPNINAFNLLLHNASRVGIASARTANSRRTYWAMVIAGDYEPQRKAGGKKTSPAAKEKSSEKSCRIAILGLCL